MRLKLFEDICFCSGHYIYIEASDGEGEDSRRTGFKARLTSALISAPEVCFTFFYHMLGSHIGALNVYKLQGTGKQLIWNQSKSARDDWYHANIYITTKKAFQVAQLHLTLNASTSQKCLQIVLILH